MITNREMGMEDYVAMARRRLPWVVIPALVAPLIGFAISFTLAPKYTSSSLLLVEGQILPTGYVNPIVTEHVSDRMITIAQNVLSRARLQPLVERLGLVRKGKTEDEVIDQIRENVAVNPYRKRGSSVQEVTNDVPGFHVNYTSDNPRDAQQVCAEITSQVIAENLVVREQVARTTTDFLSRQLEQSKHNLDDMDAKLVSFKIQHLGRMPGDMETNLKILSALNSQLDAITQNISRLQQDKDYAEMILGKEMDAIKTAQAAPSFPAIRGQLVKLQDQLVLLQTRYTDDFPDVVRTKHEIAQLQRKLKEFNAEAETSNALREATVPREGALMEPSEIMRLREQIWRLDNAIDHATSNQKRAQQRLEAFQGKAAIDPTTEEEWKQLTRDVSTAHNIYNQLLEDKSKAEIQTEMEHNQEGEQLKLLDPASLPKEPSSPIRWKFAVYGLAAGLGLGLSLAFLFEVKDKSIRDELDVLAALELPMLSAVPWTGTDGNGANRRSKFRTPRLEKEGTTSR